MSISALPIRALELRWGLVHRTKGFGRNVSISTMIRKIGGCATGNLRIATQDGHKIVMSPQPYPLECLPGTRGTFLKGDF